MKKSYFNKAIVFAALSLIGLSAGCSKEGQPAAQASGEAGDITKSTIGIVQYAEHPSLDNCREGFIQGLADAGFIEGENIKFIYKNAQADNAISQQIAQQFVSSKVDMIGAVATTAAQSAYAAAESSGIPVVYVAVADPVGSGLVGTDGKSGKPITGVSDLIPAEPQLEMIRAFLPEAKKIGILYSTGEKNSEAQLKLYEDAAAQYGFEIVKSGVTSTADVALAAKALAAKVDCFNNLTDNTVVSALPTVIDAANAAEIPVFGSEVEQVKNGCLASRGIDYVKLGAQAGAMAARVLNGEDITKMPYETVTEYAADVNVTVMNQLGLTLPEILEDATKHE